MESEVKALVHGHTALELESQAPGALSHQRGKQQGKNHQDVRVSL